MRASLIYLAFRAVTSLALIAGTVYAAKSHAQVPAAAGRYKAALTRAAHANWGLDAPVAALAAQVHQESGCNPAAVSKVGAQGLAQFMPATAAWWCQSTGTAAADCLPANATWALRALVGYDYWLLQRVQARTDCDRHAMMLSAYNGGLGWVNRDKLLASGKGLDKLAWFGQVETVNAGRTAANWSENRSYPRRILLKIAPLYAANNWGTTPCLSGARAAA